MHNATSSSKVPLKSQITYRKPPGPEAGSINRSARLLIRQGPCEPIHAGHIFRRKHDIKRLD